MVATENTQRQKPKTSIDEKRLLTSQSMKWPSTGSFDKKKDDGLKKINSWTLTEEEKSSSDIIFGKFLEQIELKEKYWVNRLKLFKY